MLNNYPSVRRWESKFVASQAKVSYAVIWLRLPVLPGEFYDLNILRKVGQKVKTLLKIDSCTSTTFKGRYARVYVQVPTEQPLIQYIYIGAHKQVIHYKGFGLLCITCGRLGLQSRVCPHASLSQKVCMEDKTSKISGNSPNTEWRLVEFTQFLRWRSPNRAQQPDANTNRINECNKGKIATKLRDPTCGNYRGVE